MDNQFIEDRIAARKLLVVQLEEAIFQLSFNNISQYTLNTGQTVQTVTKRDIVTLEKLLSSTLNGIAELEARLNGSGTVIAGPAW